MIQIGRNVKYDDYGRVTLPSDLAELLDLRKGKDEVSWFIDNGEIVLKKVTKTYMGIDCEGKEIEQKLIQFEEDYDPDFSNEGEDLSPEEREKKAWEQYREDKAAREVLKKSTSGVK